MKKLVAPIIIASLFILYFLGMFIACFLTEMPFFAKTLGVIIFIALTGVSIFVLIERIKEIRSGEEDDLGKY